MKRLLPAVIGLMVALGRSGVCASGNFQDVLWQKSSVNGSFDDSCKTRQQCVMVFVAPWCPYCQKSLPMLRALQSKADTSQSMGLRIVLSGDQSDALENEARTVGAYTFVDADGSAYKAAGQTGYPSWFSVDPSGAVLGMTVGARTDPLQVDSLLAELGVKP